VQRCPAVPTALNVIARSASAKSALGATIMALLPPSSISVRPNRAATRGATSRPMAQLPVALTNATRLSLTNDAPTFLSPIKT
ncbi:uncharacterized protein METZ01_LOCUS412334, partial [marine metagenome]